MANHTPNRSRNNSNSQAGKPLRSGDRGGSSAAEIIRKKVQRLYSAEPDATQEIAKAEAIQNRSKHQQFMYGLSASGKDLASIQTEWHDYYQGLPAEEKHQVWQEFYASQSAATHQPAPGNSAAQNLATHKHQASRPATKKLRDARTAKDVRETIRHNVTAGGKLEAKHHIQSLLFGLGMGAVVLIIFLFGFFNEVVIAPFIQPSRVTAATPLIVNNDSVTATDKTEVVIPKINVQIPTSFSEKSTDESKIENALEDGVVHYPTTSLPGEAGNTAFFGHSSNNIFNKGKYKFAFVLLHTLVEGDTFYLSYGGKMYVYKVISRQVVDPSNVGVLNPIPGKTATATLITCDPPGTSLRRLVVVGEQISPDPSGNSQATSSTITPSSQQSPALPGNGPTLWGRLTSTFIGKAVIIVAVLGAFAVGIRQVNKRLLAR